jgi:hypothetical protein
MRPPSHHLEPAANFAAKLKTITRENPGVKTIAVDLSDILEKIEERTSIKINDEFIERIL